MKLCHSVKRWNNFHPFNTYLSTFVPTHFSVYIHMSKHKYVLLFNNHYFADHIFLSSNLLCGSTMEGQIFNLTSVYKYAARKSKEMVWQHFVKSRSQGLLSHSTPWCYAQGHTALKLGKVQSRTASHLYSFRNRCYSALMTSNWNIHKVLLFFFSGGFKKHDLEGLKVVSFLLSGCFLSLSSSSVFGRSTDTTATPHQIGCREWEVQQ